MVQLLRPGFLSQPARRRSAAAAGYLDSVLASTVFDLDATIAASYGGSGTTWANLITAPADGSAQTDYDFYRGNGSTASIFPTFNGTPGDTGAYWTSDGGDSFRLKSGVNTTFLQSLHKGSNPNIQPWWIAVVLYPASATSTNGGLFTTSISFSAGAGLSLNLNGTEQVSVRQRVGSNSNSSANAVAADQYSIVILSHNNTNNLTRWINSVTGATETHNYTGGTTDSDSFAYLFAGNANSGQMRSGDRYVSIAGGNEYLDDTKAAAIIAHLNARHNRTYA